MYVLPQLEAKNTRKEEADFCYLQVIMVISLESPRKPMRMYWDHNAQSGVCGYESHTSFCTSNSEKIQW